MTYSMIFSVIVTVIFTALGMLMYLCRLSSFQEETEGQKVTHFPADGTDVLQCRHHSQATCYIRSCMCSNTMWVLILPLIYSPYNMLIMKNYFQSTIPDSLEIRFPGWRK